MMIVMNSSPMINDTLKCASKIEIFKNGQLQELDNDEFKICLNKILELFENSQIAPAFGVSLHDETIKALTEGNWIKLVFDKQQIVNELPFDTLLFRLDNCYGLNLIRGNNGRFDGRCIYINFDGQTNLNAILNFN